LGFITGLQSPLACAAEAFRRKRNFGLKSYFGDGFELRIWGGARLLKHIANGFEQILNGQRFHGQRFDSGCGGVVFGNDVAVAGTEKNMYVGTNLDALGCQFVPGQAGHGHIRLAKWDAIIQKI
jgi:hypothetical protein